MDLVVLFFVAARGVDHLTSYAYDQPTCDYARRMYTDAIKMRGVPTHPPEVIALQTHAMVGVGAPKISLEELQTSPPRTEF